MDIVWTLFAMSICLLIQGFFSGTEIAVVSADRLKLHHDATNGSKGAAIALKLLRKPEFFLTATLMGTNVATVTNATLGTALAIELLGPPGSWVAILVLSPIIWVFGEIVPKSIFQQYADKVTPVAIHVIRVLATVFYPILILFSLLTRFFTYLSGSGNKHPHTLRQQMHTILGLPEVDGDIAELEKDMIQNMLQFSETRAEDVMRPWIEVVAINKNSTIAEAIEKSVKFNHSRIPVYEERIDQVIGMIDISDYLGVDTSVGITDSIKEVIFVPGSVGVDGLLRQLRKNSNRPAIVVDEFGGARGIVTIEDIVEEVVEEIEDEYDHHHKGMKIQQLGERNYLLDGRAEIDEVNQQLNIHLPDGSYTTIAGLLLHNAREIPESGSTIKIDDYSFIIVKTTPQAIIETQIKW